MDAEGIALRPATATDDLDYVERLLSENDLPTADVRNRPGEFYVARAWGDRVGVGGVEVHGSEGLLRSVVVEERVRGEGHGAALVRALEGRATGEGVETLYLLTTTAARFFAGLGYETVERGDVPESIRSTTEFAELCPDSATVQRTSL